MSFAKKTLLLTVFLAGCGSDDVILPGTREPIRPEAAATLRPGAPLTLAAPRANADWTHRQGSASHAPGHPALATQLAPAFTVSIGAGDGGRTRITAAPVVAGGRVFAMDAQGQVSAHSTTGAPLWSANVVPPHDGAAQGAGGGLAYGGGKLFVTTGYGRLTALDPATGGEIWTQRLDAPGGGAPTYADGTVYLAARDGTGWAVRADTGRVRWTFSAAPSQGTQGTGPGVAVAGGMAVFPFAGGTLKGVFAQGGTERWSAVLAGDRLGSAVAQFADIAGDPVIVGDTVYVANGSGRVAALKRDSGEMIWQAEMAARAPIWVAGGSVFLVNGRNELVRLDARDGAVVWRTQLPAYAERRFRAPNRLYAHYGPILAGGRLIVASSDGYLRQFDPRSGALAVQSELPAGAAAMPAVAGGALYVVTRDGALTAFR